MQLQFTPALKILKRFVGQSGIKTGCSAVLAQAPRRFVATDGMQLAIIDVEPYDTPPFVPECEFDATVDHMFIDPDSLETLCKGIPAGKSLGAEQRRGYLSSVSGFKATVVTKERYADVKEHVLRLKDGIFPRYENVMPQQPPVASCRINPAFLEDIARAAKAIEARSVEIRVYPPSRYTGFPSPIMAVAENTDGVTLTIVQAQIERKGRPEGLDPDTASQMLALAR